MKVLHVTNNYPTEKFPIFGIFVKEQIDSLSELGIENELFFINGREKGKLDYFLSIFRLAKFLGNKNYDVIHCHHALSALILILSGFSKKNKVVVSFQNDPVHEFGIFLYKFIQKRTNAWLFKNNSSLIQKGNFFYQPNGVNTTFFKPIFKNQALNYLNLKSGTIFVLFVSSNYIRKQKRYDRFLNVIEILKNEFNYSNIEVLKMINIERDKIPYFFNAADVHLLTSDFEGSPNSVKEAMACETPVVSTNVGNVREMLANVNGSFVGGDNCSRTPSYC